MKLRALCVVLHRWSGLTIAVFLVVAGLTGSVLVFRDKLIPLSAPALFAAAPPAPDAKPLDAGAIAERVRAQTGAEINYVPLDFDPRHALTVFVEAAPGQPALDYDTVVADPYTGAVRKRYRYGRLSEGTQNIAPFLLEVHYSFAAGAWGTLVFGVAALVWTFNSLVGLLLTLPTVRRRQSGEAGAGPSAFFAWLRRWGLAWRVSVRARGFKLQFGLHRAMGLWLWPLLLVFAWSSVGFNLPKVHGPVMRLFGAQWGYEPPALAQPLAEPALTPTAAVAAGCRLMEEQAQGDGFRVERAVGLSYLPAAGAYRLVVRTSLDVTTEHGDTTVWLDANDGRLLHYEPPLGRTRADAFTHWLNVLHFAQVGALPYRLFVSALGLGVVGLSVTGTLIWMRKQSARTAVRTQRQTAAMQDA